MKTRTSPLQWLLIGAAVLALAACSASTTSIVATDAASDGSVETTTNVASDTAGDDPAADDTADSAVSTETAEPDAAATLAPPAVPTPVPAPTPAPEPLLANAPTIVSTTVTEGATITPTFSWEPVANDATYFLVVKDEAGTPYWSWSGSEAEIRMHDGGPTIAAGYTWSVSAFDAADNFLAISPEFTIAP